MSDNLEAEKRRVRDQREAFIEGAHWACQRDHLGPAEAAELRYPMPKPRRMRELTWAGQRYRWRTTTQAFEVWSGAHWVVPQALAQGPVSQVPADLLMVLADLRNNPTEEIPE